MDNPNIALILQPSANIMVCDAHNTEWLCHSHTIDVACRFCQEFAMAQDLTQSYLLDLSFVLILTLALLILILVLENLPIW